MGEYMASGAAKKNYQSSGAVIMQLAEEIRPYLLKKLEGCHDENDLPVQPGRIRAIALALAQEWWKYYQSTQSN